MQVAYLLTPLLRPRPLRSCILGPSSGRLVLAPYVMFLATIYLMFSPKAVDTTVEFPGHRRRAAQHRSAGLTGGGRDDSETLSRPRHLLHRDVSEKGGPSTDTKACVRLHCAALSVEYILECTLAAIVGIASQDAGSSTRRISQNRAVVRCHSRCR